ncbi:hypothetical protein [Photobacterium leiognathi]|uniref:hypothetical protein n=1 Tax=Photobacterium leiognathi TaxID=553611 RepID=UPI0029827397|nr:hypothetical protein [Photobacterium leiognathi]
MEKFDEKLFSELNDGHILEAVDRCYLTANFIESTLLDHGLVDAVPAFKEKAKDAQRLLLELYQDIGQSESLAEIKKEHCK